MYVKRLKKMWFIAHPKPSCSFVLPPTRTPEGVLAQWPEHRERKTAVMVDNKRLLPPCSLLRSHVDYLYRDLLVDSYFVGYNHSAFIFRMVCGESRIQRGRRKLQIYTRFFFYFM